MGRVGTLGTHAAVPPVLETGLACSCATLYAAGAASARDATMLPALPLQRELSRKSCMLPQGDDVSGRKRVAHWCMLVTHVTDAKTACPSNPWRQHCDIGMLSMGCRREDSFLLT